MAELLPLPHRPAPRRGERHDIELRPGERHDIEPRRGERHDIEPLWRDALGALLRRIRLARGERLADTATRAGVSPQYLSEVERGLKEPSSEMIAAIAGALGVTLIELTATIAVELRPASAPALARGSIALAA